MGLFKLPELIFLDFETFFDSENGYTLNQKNKKGGLSLVEYVRDPRFKIFGVSSCNKDSTSMWLENCNVQKAVSGTYWQDKAIVCHNTKFDGFILLEKFGINPALWIDTRGMAKAVLGKRVKNHSLRTLAEYYNLPAKGSLNTDGIKDLTPQQEKELADYCNHDVWLTREIFNRLKEEFPNNQYQHLDWTIRTFVNPKLELNNALLAEIHNNENKKKREIFDAIGIDKKVFSSNKQFPKLLEDEGFEIPTKESPRTGESIPALALGDPAFRAMCESENPRLKELCEARIAAKSVLLETRSLNLLDISKTGSWPFDVQFSGATQTHRYSGDKQSGGNPQNFPKVGDLRKTITVPNGYSLIIADFDKVEARLVGYLSQDPELVRMFDRGLDTYCDFASTYYGREITKKDKQERKFGKTAILGLGYNMGAKKFKWTALIQAGLQVSQEEAYTAVNLYRSRYFRVPLLWQKLQDFIPQLCDGSSGRLLNLPLTYEKEAIILPSGLKIRYPNLHKDGKEWIFEAYDKGQLRKQKLYGGKILENICQALAGELCKEALIEFKDVATGQVHDEIHLVVPDKDVDKYAKALYTKMSTSPSWFPRLRLEAEIKVGKNWGDAKLWKEKKKLNSLSV